MNNLFADVPSVLPEEFSETLAYAVNVRIERIVSRGQSSPPGFWYDQSQHEWVAVLQGQARLIIEGRHKPLELGPGDYVNIPARVRHRVEWTTPDEPTVWLAIFYS